MNAALLTWIIAGSGTAGVILRPFRWPEAVWACAAAGLLVALGLLGLADALAGVLKGLDVYLFLAGMMLLSELARREGLFDWLAALATRAAAGSPHRLFLLVYLVGTVVTAFLSNDATAVVLTPAVYAAARAAEVRDPLPYLFVCAFVANAASFVLPISNPANLVVFAGHMPPLLEWLRIFALPSLLSILATYAMLRLAQRRALAADSVAVEVEMPALSRYGRLAAGGIALAAAALVAASALGRDLGLPTLLAGLITAAAILAWKRESPRLVIAQVSWGVLPLVAGLFVLVEALDRTGVIRTISEELRRLAAAAPDATALGAGILVAAATNLGNNLPVGLVAGSAVQAAEVSRKVAARDPGRGSISARTSR